MKIIISGDFAPFTQYDSKNFKVFDPEYSTELREYLDSANYHITNLECPLTSGQSSIKKIGPALKSLPQNVGLLKKAKVNVTCLANNHILDFEEEGLGDTIKLLKTNNIGFVGAGREESEIKEPFLISDTNNPVAVVNLGDKEFTSSIKSKAAINNIDPIDNFYQISKLRKKNATIIAILHTGQEYSNCPSPNLKQYCRFLVDLGVSAIICHHTHLISGFELYKNVPIFYGLGNFNFYREKHNNSGWRFGLIVKLFLQKSKIEFEYKIIEQDYKNGQIKFVDEEKLNFYQNKIKNLNGIIKNDYELEKEFELFTNNRELSYLSYIFTNNKYTRKFYTSGIYKPFYSKVKLRYLWNIIRCDSHRDVFLKILEKKIF